MNILTIYLQNRTNLDGLDECSKVRAQLMKVCVMSQACHPIKLQPFLQVCTNVDR